MKERRLEIHPFAQVAEKVGHGRAAGLIEQSPDGEGAGRVRELRLRAVEAGKA